MRYNMHFLQQRHGDHDQSSLLRGHTPCHYTITKLVLLVIRALQSAHGGQTVAISRYRLGL